MRVATSRSLNQTPISPKAMQMTRSSMSRTPGEVRTSPGELERKNEREECLMAGSGGHAVGWRRKRREQRLIVAGDHTVIPSRIWRGGDSCPGGLRGGGAVGGRSSGRPAGSYRGGSGAFSSARLRIP
ncbi:hypothetical protein [Methanoculleus chikugoensis]|uniref:hypothetical protein n=1 Tax=Methanoculleus chikugoensis TaxID=118126 RepID=UPI001FB44B34|nr:hypothetical protein [Methanoculleus chikugoensis]